MITDIFLTRKCRNHQNYSFKTILSQIRVFLPIFLFKSTFKDGGVKTFFFFNLRFKQSFAIYGVSTYYFFSNGKKMCNCNYWDGKDPPSVCTSSHVKPYEPTLFHTELFCSFWNMQMFIIYLWHLLSSWVSNCRLFKILGGIEYFIFHVELLNQRAFFNQFKSSQCFYFF